MHVCVTYLCYVCMFMYVCMYEKDSDGFFRRKHVVQHAEEEDVLVSMSGGERAEGRGRDVQAETDGAQWYAPIRNTDVLYVCMYVCMCIIHLLTDVCMFHQMYYTNPVSLRLYIYTYIHSFIDSFHHLFMHTVHIHTYIRTCT